MFTRLISKIISKILFVNVFYISIGLNLYFSSEIFIN
jgi:hypothetical protein